MNKFKTFNIKPSWVYSKQKARIIKEMKYIQERIMLFSHFLYDCTPEELWLIKDYLEEFNQKLKQLKRKKYHLNRLIKEHRYFETGKTTNPPQLNNFDIAEIKKIPLDKITKIESNGFFSNNPFRTEHSPSNSLHWDKRINRWCDYGSGDIHGDVIDLYMKLNTCDFVTACKELQGFV